MKQNIISTIVNVVITLAVVFTIGIFSANKTPANVAGTVENFPVWFTNGISLGSSQQISISSAGAISSSGSLSTTGQVRLGGNPVSIDKDGTIVSVNATATTTLTSAQICDNPYFNISFTNTNGIVTTPTAANMIAGTCLTSIGDTINFKIRNSSATSTNFFQIVAGASSSVSKIAATGATSSVLNLGIANVSASLITSSTPWVVWSVTPFQ